MAKNKKKGGSGERKSADEPLAEATDTFTRGDYARARVMLKQKAQDPNLSEGQREEAEELYEATTLERGTLYVGLACIALFILVVVVTSLTQPH
jgi:hypothetical protein